MRSAKVEKRKIDNPTPLATARRIPQFNIKRAKGVTPDKIKGLFDTLDEPLLRHVRPQHRYNMDETGIMEGVGANGKHIASVKQHGTKKRCWALVKGQANRI